MLWCGVVLVLVDVCCVVCVYRALLCVWYVLRRCVVSIRVRDVLLWGGLFWCVVLVCVVCCVVVAVVCVMVVLCWVCCWYVLVR